MYEQLGLNLGMPAGIGSVRNIGNPRDYRRQLGEIPIAGYSLGVETRDYPAYGSFDPLVTSPGYVAIPRGTRSTTQGQRQLEGEYTYYTPLGSPKRATPLVARSALQSTGNYTLDSPSIYKTVSEGTWNDDTYTPGPDRNPGRPQKGIEPLLTGTRDSVVLTDQALIPGRLRPESKLQPSYQSNPQSVARALASKGVVTADEVIFNPRSGALPADIGPILADYGRKSNFRTGMPFPERSIDPNQADETGFSSLDPTQVSSVRAQSNINPYGVVEMPAINARGDWKNDFGRPLVARVDPTRVVEIRTANPDATFTADQTQEITLGAKARELREENRTPVLSASRLEELRRQGRAVVAPGEGTQFGYVARYDLEDRPIIRSGDRLFVAPSQDYALGDGERVVGVRKAVPVLRTEPLYRATDGDGEQITGKRLMSEGRQGAREVVEPVYRVGNPMSYDRDAVREDLQPYIPGSGSVGGAARVGQGALNVALQRGTAQFFGQPEDAAANERQLGLPIVGAGGNLYVERGGMDPALVVQRRRADGTPIPGAYLVENTSLGRRPVGPAPFLLPPEGSTQDEIRAIGGIRRRGEQIGPGMEFDELITNLTAGSFMADPDIASGYAKLAEMVENGQLTLEQLQQGGVIRRNTREGALLAQAINDRRPGRRVDLFAEGAIDPADAQLAREMGAELQFDSDILGATDQQAGSIAGDEHVARWGNFGDGGYSITPASMGDDSQIEPFVRYAQGFVGDRRQAEDLAAAAIRGTRPRVEGAPLEAGDVINSIRFMVDQPVYSGRSEGGRAPAVMTMSSQGRPVAAAPPAVFPGNPSIPAARGGAEVVQPGIPGIPLDRGSLAKGYTPDPIDQVAEYMSSRPQRASYRYIAPPSRQLNLFRRR